MRTHSGCASIDSSSERGARRRRARGTIVALICATIAASLGGCFPVRYDPERATRPYPVEISGGERVSVQVTRDGENLVLVNATARDFGEFDLWLNRRFVLRVDGLAPGATRRLALANFFDVWGGGPNPGGLLSWYAPTPIVLAEAQVDDETPMVGFVTVVAETELERIRLDR